MGETLKDTKPLLADIDGGRVLDIATGRGGYVHELVDGLASYDEIVGIDSQASLRTTRASRTARSIWHRSRHHSITSLIPRPYWPGCGGWSGPAGASSSPRCTATARPSRS
jgi:hypothetical protein